MGLGWRFGGFRTERCHQAYNPLTLLCRISPITLGSAQLREPVSAAPCRANKIFLGAGNTVCGITLIFVRIAKHPGCRRGVPQDAVRHPVWTPWAVEVPARDQPLIPSIPPIPRRSPPAPCAGPRRRANRPYENCPRSAEPEARTAGGDLDGHCGREARWLALPL